MEDRKPCYPQGKHLNCCMRGLFYIFLTKKTIFFFSFYIPIPVPTPSTPPHPLLRDGKAHCFGFKAHLTLCRMSRVSVQREWVPKKPVQAVGKHPGAIVSGPAVCPSHTTVTHIQRIYFDAMLVDSFPVWLE